MQKTNICWFKQMHFCYNWFFFLENFSIKILLRKLFTREMIKKITKLKPNLT
jgi:hypothetical protein